MIARANGVLLLAYVIIAASGVLFLVNESNSLDVVATYASTNVIWGAFYMVGGATSALAVVARARARNTVPLWYFEVAGLCLIIAANLGYVYALSTITLLHRELDVLAAALIILAFSASLTSRSIETLRLVKAIKELSNHVEDSG